MSDEDLYCLECGYNLRGLQGDPRRCPECNTRSSLDDLRVPADLLRQQAKKLETLPSVCVAWVLAALWFGVPLVVHHERFGIAFCLAIAIAWVLTARAFARSCEGRPGWAVLLLEFHATALLLLSFVLGLGVTVVSLARGGRWLALQPFLISLVLVTAGTLLYRDARRRLAIVRRRAAVELAKRELALRRAR